MADEYIRREDALKLLSDDIPICGASLYQEGAKGGLQIAHGIVAAIPAADVAPVVRCEKCLYRSQYANKDGFYKCGVLGCEDEDCVFVSPDFGCIAGVLRGKQMDGGDSYETD